MVAQTWDLPDEYDYDDTEAVNCPRCDGWGEVSCRCGGDLCVCENYGDAPCPLCHTEGHVSAEVYEKYLAAQRESARLFAEARAKIDAEHAQRKEPTDAD